jgi:hypothetical protein
VPDADLSDSAKQSHLGTQKLNFEPKGTSKPETQDVKGTTHNFLLDFLVLIREAAANIEFYSISQGRSSSKHPTTRNSRA